jgi:hypothetical protein
MLQLTIVVMHVHCLFAVFLRFYKHSFITLNEKNILLIEWHIYYLKISKIRWRLNKIDKDLDKNNFHLKISENII